MIKNAIESAYGDIKLYSVEQYTSGEIEVPPTSILLIKPELQLMDRESTGILFRLIGEVVQTYGQIVDPFWVKLDRETADNLWLPDIGKYPWAKDYCAYMASAPCLAFALSGDESAFNAKKHIRCQMADTIANLQIALASEFQPDIVHGSDKEDAQDEFLIFCRNKLNQVINLGF